MENVPNYCDISHREEDWTDPNTGVIWRDTGLCGYYLMIGSKGGTCALSKLHTNYLDINFEGWVHPEYLEAAWKDYFTSVQNY
jgi:hypothetical protein